MPAPARSAPTRAAVLLAAAALAAAGASGCASSSDDGTGAGGAPTSGAVPTPATPATTTTSAGATRPGRKLRRVDVRDPVLGHRVRVTRVIRSFPIPATYAELRGREELVLLRVRLTAGTRYTDGLDVGDLRLIADDREPGRPPTELFDEAAERAGHDTLGTSVDPGNTDTGWLAFLVAPADATTLTLRYSRPASEVPGRTKPIQARDFDAELIG